jgi:hypothetical protein
VVRTFRLLPDSRRFSSKERASTVQLGSRIRRSLYGPVVLEGLLGSGSVTSGAI